MQIEDNSTKILHTWSVIQLAGKVMKELDFFGISIYDPLGPHMLYSYTDGGKSYEGT